MPRLLIRLIALFLIPIVLMDPATAADLSPFAHGNIGASTANQSRGNCFKEQALNPIGLWFAHEWESLAAMSRVRKTTPAPLVLGNDGLPDISLDRHLTAVSVETWLRARLDPEQEGRYRNLIRVIRQVVVPMAEQIEFAAVGTVVAAMWHLNTNSFYHAVLGVLGAWALRRYAVVFGQQHHAPAWVRSLASLWLSLSVGCSVFVLSSVGLHSEGFGVLGLFSVGLTALQIAFGLAASLFPTPDSSLTLFDHIYFRTPGLNLPGPLAALQDILGTLSNGPYGAQTVNGLRTYRRRVEALEQQLQALMNERGAIRQQQANLRWEGDPIELRARIRTFSAAYANWLDQVEGLFDLLPAAPDLTPVAEIQEAMSADQQQRITQALQSLDDVQGSARDALRTARTVNRAMPALLRRPLEAILFEHRAGDWQITGTSDRFLRTQSAPYDPPLAFSFPSVSGGDLMPVISRAELRVLLRQVTNSSALPYNEPFIPNSPFADSLTADYRVEPVPGLIPAVDFVLQVVSAHPLDPIQYERDPLIRLIRRQRGIQVIIRPADTTAADSDATRTMADDYLREVVVRVPAIPGSWISLSRPLIRLFTSLMTVRRSSPWAASGWLGGLGIIPAPLGVPLEFTADAAAPLTLSQRVRFLAGAWILSILALGLWMQTGLFLWQKSHELPPSPRETNNREEPFDYSFNSPPFYVERATPGHSLEKKMRELATQEKGDPDDIFTIIVDNPEVLAQGVPARPRGELLYRRYSGASDGRVLAQLRERLGDAGFKVYLRTFDEALRDELAKPEAMPRQMRQEMNRRERVWLKWNIPVRRMRRWTQQLRDAVELDRHAETRPFPYRRTRLVERIRQILDIASRLPREIMRAAPPAKVTGRTTRRLTRTHGRDEAA